jgi:signal transduction histidine kinase
LIWLAKEVERSTGMEIHRDIDAALDLLPDSHRTCVFRVVQEALTNASRHSGARTIDVRVTRDGRSVKVRVSDDGRGFDAVAAKGKGIGLLGMEERVRELGGHMHLSSVPGRGTSVEISLPEPASIEVNQIHATNDSNNSNDSHDRGRPRDRADGVKATIGADPGD